MNVRDFIEAVVASRASFTWEIVGDREGDGKRFIRAKDASGQYLDPINVVAKLRGHTVDMCDPLKVGRKLGMSQDLSLRLVKASDYRGDETLQRMLASAALRGKRIGDK